MNKSKKKRQKKSGFSFLFLITAIILLSCAGVMAIDPFNSALPWHSLQQIISDDAGMVPVDADADGFVDAANAAGITYNVSCESDACISVTEVDFNFATSTSQGGDALYATAAGIAGDISCTGCVDSTALSVDSVGDFELTDNPTFTTVTVTDYVTAAGGIHVGGTSDPGTDNLLVDGDVNAGAYYYSSDVRLKENIKPINSALATIQMLQGVEFSWKKNNKADIGFIAQDVEQVIPFLVKTDTNTGLKSVEYANMVALAIEAIKEQQNIIDKQQEEIDALKEQVQALMNQ